MKEIKEYITEHIISRGRKRNKTIVTEEMSIDDFCKTIEECGINWCPGMSVLNSRGIERAMKTHHYQYDTFIEPRGMITLMVVTDRKCFIFSWNNTSSNGSEGIIESSQYYMDGNSVVLQTGTVKDIVADFNKELDKDLF